PLVIEQRVDLRGDALHPVAAVLVIPDVQRELDVLAVLVVRILWDAVAHADVDVWRRCALGNTVPDLCADVPVQYRVDRDLQVGLADHRCRASSRIRRATAFLSRRRYFGRSSWNAGIRNGCSFVPKRAMCSAMAQPALSGSSKPCRRAQSISGCTGGMCGRLPNSTGGPYSLLVPATPPSWSASISCVIELRSGPRSTGARRFAPVSMLTSPRFVSRLTSSRTPACMRPNFRRSR